MWGTAPYSIHTNFPVNSIADLKGKTIRASSKNESAALRAFGAVPIGMPVTEIPEAISRGTISGTTSHMSPFFDFGLDRVTNNHFFIGLGVVPLAVLSTRKNSTRCPTPSRAVIERNAGDKLTKLWIESITAYNAANLKKLESNPKNKVVFPSQAQLDNAQKLLTPVRDEWVAASPRHKELKVALDAELAAVRGGSKGMKRPSGSGSVSRQIARDLLSQPIEAKHRQYDLARCGSVLCMIEPSNWVRLER